MIWFYAFVFLKSDIYLELVGKDNWGSKATV